MAITNGYATLIEMRDRLLDRRTYTAATLSFTAASKTITDTAFGLRRFQSENAILISGSTSNDGHYTIATGGVAGTLIVNETLVDEAAGDTITISDVTEQESDAQLESVIEAISRWIDFATERRFYAASETRYYTAEWSDSLDIDDLLSVTTLKTDDGSRAYGATWLTTDYDLAPFNAVLDGKPYTLIEIAPAGAQSFPLLSKGVELVGSFGYSVTAPAGIVEACLLAGERLARRKDAIFGVTGSGGLGQLRAILDSDPDVARLLAPFKRLAVFG